MPNGNFQRRLPLFSLPRQPSVAVHTPGALAFIARLFGFRGFAFLKPINEFDWRNVAGFTEVERFQKINAPLADFGFRDESLWLAKFFGKRRLTQAGFFANFPQQRAEPAMTR